MVSADLARTSFGIIGNITALVLFLSPVPTFIQIVKKGAVEKFSPVPYLATFMNCGIWVLYGLPMVHPHSFLLITINSAGILIEIVYLLLFLYHSVRKQRIKVLLIMLAELVFLFVLTLLALMVAHTTTVRSNVVGSFAIVGNVIMYAAPLSVMKLVITTKSLEYMPFCLSLFSFLNGVTWTVYALIHFDPFIVIPSGLGSLLGVAQLILYATFYKSRKRQPVETGSTEMGFAEKKATNETGQTVGPTKISNVAQFEYP